ncbi:MAG TPA: TRAP transporter substrate-binding protein [Alphaproteobacteria bacterium]|nr:TRAP transporter substrate-binding protein [Alphaproteobacteria bacterium]
MKSVLGGVVAASLALAAGSAGAEDKRFRLKMHSAFSSNTDILGPAGVRIAENLGTFSNGTLRVQFFEPGALVPGIQYFDPVSSGSLQMAYGTPGYGVGQEPALAFFTAVPFGPPIGEYLAWVFYGGGHELYDEILANYNIKGRICNAIPPEASGWFREPVESVDDLKGIKMRFFGLGSRVMEKIGVSTQLLAGGDIYPALELGSIDATEFSMPSIDETLGFYQIAKHYYLPGWHQPTSLGEIMFNMDVWNEFSDYQKQVVDIVCDANITQEYVDGEARQGDAMYRMENEHGVTVHRWSDGDLAKLEKLWYEVAEEEAAKDETFGKVWKSYSEFREKHKSWGERGYLD